MLAGLPGHLRDVAPLVTYISRMEHAFFRKLYPYPLVQESELREIMDAHAPVGFSRHDVLLAEGQQANAYYVIRKGWVREWVRGVDGSEITTRFFGPGAFVLEPASLFQRIPSRTNLEAISSVSGGVVSYEDFQRLYHERESVREWGRAWMSSELFLLRQRTIDMLQLSATDRYLNLLEEQPEVLAHAPLKYIASYLGVTDSSLSRIRKEISRGGAKLS